MATATGDRLNSLLRGEIAAVETYQQALDKFAPTKGASELRRIHDEHREAANTLRKHVHQHGQQPDQGSGVWGTFAKAVEGTAKVLGDDAALKALKEGEEHGVNAYEDALKDDTLPNDCKQLIQSSLLPQAREHIPVLDRLMAGVVERISPQEAQADLRSDPNALLVCAYDSQEKCEQYHLDGAISLTDFKSRTGTLDKDREVIFYCA